MFFYLNSQCNFGIITASPFSRIGTYGVTKYNPSGNFLTIYCIQTQYTLLLGEQVLTIFLCIKRLCLNWNFIVNDVQSATYSSHGAPCLARDLFPWLNTRMKVHISLWTIREYLKRHFRYFSDSGDTFLPLILVVMPRIFSMQHMFCIWGETACINP